MAVIASVRGLLRNVLCTRARASFYCVIAENQAMEMLPDDVMKRCHQALSAVSPNGSRLPSPGRTRAVLARQVDHGRWFHRARAGIDYEIDLFFKLSRFSASLTMVSPA